MREVPECLNRRYRALDELIKELGSALSNHSSHTDCPMNCTKDVGIKLMCDFWNILKEDPECNLTEAVQKRMGLVTAGSGFFHPERITCYMACNPDQNNDKNKSNMSCQSGEKESPKSKCCGSKSLSPSAGSDVLPLSKVLCNLKEAASFDKKCHAKLNNLMIQEKELQEQIKHLEHREKEGVQLLKQADCMWSCMEDAYKKKVAESLERQKILLKQMKEVEASATKWRKNKKELEVQMDNINKCHEEITDKINEKTNDMKCMDREIEDFKKRIENNKKDVENAKKSLGTKKQASDAKIANLAAEMTRFQKIVSDEHRHKLSKEAEGTGYIKEAREDLQKICRVLLQKKLENEDLMAEKEALSQELDLLKITCDQCKEKCKNKQQSTNDEITKIEKEIAGFKIQCLRCHVCTDTVDVRKFCTDCPKCIEERECLYDDDHCSPDHTMDCVCMSVKQKFLDNVFDNMYTVLARQVKTGPGKAVADAVLECLKRSRNGKLNEETRKILQEFVLTTVKKNLNLTIVGGAVKTRCELDPETYKQLMLCLKQIKTTRPPKADKGTPAKKDPCRRWGVASECNCPRGPKACVCTRKAPPPPGDPTPCPPQPQDKEDVGPILVCPHKESIACGADCAMHAVPSSVGADVAAWRPDPCHGQTCPFSKNMRAAQCMLGPESLASMPMSKGYPTTIPYLPNDLVDEMTCKCGSTPSKSCVCNKDAKQLKAGIAKQCDKDTCSMIWDQSKHMQRSFSLTEREIRKESYNKNDFFLQQKMKHIPSVHADILSQAQQDIGTEAYTPGKIFNDIKNGTFDQAAKRSKQVAQAATDEFKVMIQSESGNLSDQFTELTTTTSGNLAMALEEKIIEVIERRIREDPNVFVFLKKTESGHNVIDFSPREKAPSDSQRIIVRRSPSDNLYIELQKSLINTIQPDIIMSDNKAKHELASQSSVSIEIKKKKEKKDNKENGHMKTSQSYNKKKISQNDNDKLMKVAIKDNKKTPDHKAELQQIFEQNSKITLKIQNTNKILSNITVKLGKTSSGNIAIDAENVPGLKELISKSKEHPVLLTKTSFGSYILDISPKGYSSAPNAMLRRTPSGAVLVVITESVLKPMKPNKLNAVQTKNEFFTVKVKGDNTLSKTILKLTPSDNYVIILDKEFEKRYRQTINENIGDDSECYVGLEKTDSGNYEINFNISNNKSPNTQHALLVKSPSGNIKVLVNAPMFEAMEEPSSKNDSMVPSLKKSSKAFEHLLSHLSPINNELHKYQSKKITRLDTKSSSDSNLYEKVKFKFQNQEHLFTEPSALLKKTESGQYAVVLNKESKKKMITSLKSFLSSDSQGLIPIKRTESGEITIILNGKNEARGQYESLKITPSGNIYVLVNEKVVNKMPKAFVDKEVTESAYDDTKSEHLIGKVRHPMNKGVATTCNARPHDLNTCNATKCICKELQDVKSDWFYDRLEKDEDLLFQPQMCGVDWKKLKRNLNGSFKVCDPKKCKNKCNTENKDDSKDKSPHIVIKPCGCSKPEKSHHTEQCFYVMEAVCPFHKDRYESVSNELLEISGLCNKKSHHRNNVVDNKYETVECEENNTGDYLRNTLIWDQVENLPPQLPLFLRDFDLK